MLEQAAIAEAIADARLERVELLRQRHDHAAADLLAMAVDDAHGLGGLFVAHRDRRLAQRRHRERKQPRRRPGGAHRFDAVAVEQRLDDAGLDVRRVRKTTVRPRSSCGAPDADRRRRSVTAGDGAFDPQQDHRHVVVLVGAAGERAHLGQDVRAQLIERQVRVLLDHLRQARFAEAVERSRSSSR